MGRPQQPELARSGRTDLDPDRIGTELEGRKDIPSKGRTGPVPPENEPGHHPPEESDKPDPDAFVAKMSGEGRPGPGRWTIPRLAGAGPAAAGLARSGLRLSGRVLGRLQGMIAERLPRRA